MILLRIHAAIFVAWLILIVPSIFWWSNSVPWLVFMSAWANVQAAAATLQACWTTVKATKEKAA